MQPWSEKKQTIFIWVLATTWITTVIAVLSMVGWLMLNLPE